MKYRFSLLSIGVFVAMEMTLASNRTILGKDASAYASESVLSTVNFTLNSTVSSKGTPFAELDNLNLTATQQDQVAAIRADMTSEMASILTSAQMEKFRAGQSNGTDMRRLMMSLGLNSDQRSSVISMVRSTQNRIMAVLTPAQRSQLESRVPRQRS